MKFFFGILFTFTLASTAHAQGADIVAAAKQQLEGRGVNLSGACGAAKITNLVAWSLRPRFGLLHKAGGNRAILKADGSCLTGEQSNDPEGIATDYLIERATGHGFDLLGDGGGANVPQWAGPEDAPDMVARNFSEFREPVEPSFPTAPPPPPSCIVGVNCLPPPVTPPAQEGVLIAKVDALTLKVDQLQAGVSNLTSSMDDAHKAINQNITDGRAENRSFFSAVGAHWKSITAVAGPIVTWYVAKATGKPAGQ